MADCYPENHPYNPFGDIAANPLDTDFLMQLAPEFAEHVFFALLHNTMQDAATYRRVADAFFAYCEKRDVPSRMQFEISAAVSQKEHHRKRCDKNAFSHAFSFVLDL